MGRRAGPRKMVFSTLARERVQKEGRMRHCRRVLIVVDGAIVKVTIAPFVWDFGIEAGCCVYGCRVQERTSFQDASLD
jgi:hypothetical protein